MVMMMIVIMKIVITTVMMIINIFDFDSNNNDMDDSYGSYNVSYNNDDISNLVLVDKLLYR